MKKLVKESLNETNPSSLIDEKKLKEYADAIAILCNGEYGNVFYNESQNHVFVCLGDSNPFGDQLEDYMKDAIAKDYNSQKHIKITIENESGPNTTEGGWKEIN